MSTSIPTSLTVIPEADTRGQALAALIKKYCTNLQVYYGFRTIGSADIVFPCVMIDPVREKIYMASLGKYRIYITYNIYWYCQESSSSAIVSQAVFIGEYLMKLLSNNALGTADGSFKQYPNPNGGYYWLDSEMSDVTWSTSYRNATPDNQKNFMRAGLMQFVIEDQILK